MKSYKTTIMGVLAIIGAAVSLAQAVMNGSVNGEVISASLSAIMAGIGLIAAKDSNVTGGTVKQ